MARSKASGRVVHDLGIVDALAELSFLVQETLARRAAEHDLSLIQARLLGVLRDRQPSMQQLARVLSLDKSSVSGLVDRAEKRGLVQRMPSTDDRRAVHVSLTSSGRRTVEQVVAEFGVDIGAATTCLSAAEAKRLSTLATRVVSAARPAAGPMAGGPGTGGSKGTASGFRRNLG
jgi:DNA-binding MarR family transcriptional regulator